MELVPSIVPERWCAYVFLKWFKGSWGRSCAYRFIVDLFDECVLAPPEEQ
jgi:hypothetical protein